jgi:hypothetical protein
MTARAVVMAIALITAALLLSKELDMTTSERVVPQLWHSFSTTTVTARP